ncbi:hypothetical protein [Pyxidicoccus xibeiensis]|uniref:hypothetical protein n=1 Tax=Pyxidicoccus xibeiensis TaxID=2906759 RepID=UPI0020A7A8EF|nr:hypothetical protein [Pyxidicoccus xibeiensis]MCP3135764.1 hypothetical protein [Pyxidicoccus xibeiensis]
MRHTGVKSGAPTRGQATRRASAWLLTAVCLSLPVVAGAHEGESHGAAPARVPMQEALHVLAATGDVFEVVLKHPEQPTGPKTPLRLLVADSMTNAPVSGAQVELTLTGAAVQSLVPRMESPGVYVAEAELKPEQELVAVATVTRGDSVDVLALGTVHVDAETSEGSEDHEHADGWLAWGVAGGVALMVGAGAWWVSRRKRGML